NREASEGYVCSAHSFPVNAGPAISESIREVNDAAFSKIVPGGTMTAAGEGADEHVVFQLEQFNARLHFETGFWQATAIANTDLALKVTVLDASGKETQRAVASGSGYGELDGGCDAGAKALEAATNQAIKNTMESYVSRMINSGQI